MTSKTAAVLGLGSIGLRHARNLLELGFEVRGYDPDPARRALLEGEGAQAFEDQLAALGGAGAAIIAGPSASHLEAAAAALDAGCHVLIEKPFAHTTSGIEALLQTAAQKKLVLAAAHNLRFHPAIEKAHALISDGKLGLLLWARFLCSSYLPDWRPDQDYRKNYTADETTGGVIFDIIHEFDLAHYLLGAFETVAASSRRSGELEIPAEDCADIILRHPGGFQSALHLDYATRPSRRIGEIAGSEGLLEFDLINRRLTFTGKGAEILNDHTYPGDNADTYRHELDDFFAAIDGGRAPRCGGGEALAVLAQVITAREMSGLPGA